jgi:hypothetical protein
VRKFESAGAGLEKIGSMNEGIGKGGRGAEGSREDVDEVALGSSLEGRRERRWMISDTSAGPRARSEGS